MKNGLMEWYTLLVAMLVVIATSILTFIAASYWAGKTRNESLQVRIHELEKQMVGVNAAVAPISQVFQQILIKELTHFHTPELDALMARVGPPTTLSVLETKRLEVLLRERSLDMAEEMTAMERDAAVMLPMVMRRVIEAVSTPRVLSEPILVQLVSLPETYILSPT